MHSVKAFLVLVLFVSLSLAQFEEVMEATKVVEKTIEPVLEDILPSYFTTTLSDEPPHVSKGKQSSPAFGLPEIHWWDRDGLVNPPSKWQRYRGNDFPFDIETTPFFQWWYFNLADYENNRYYLITYSTLRTPKNASETVFVMSVGYVDAKNGERWTKEEVWPLSVLNISNYFDLQAKNGEEVMFGLQVIDDNTYRLYGKMNHTDHTISVDFPKDTPISWNVTLSRINGWYGEQDLEDWMKLSAGEISWNPYAHNCLVGGFLTAGDKTTNYVNSKQFRAYGDMNWGNKFPSGDSIDTAMQFPWGWYTVNVPNDDPLLDFAIVVGVGTVKNKDTLGKSWAAFGDFIIAGKHIGVRKVMIWNGYTLMSTTNDGAITSFSSFPYDFQNFTGSNGLNYSVPLKQVLIVETSHYSMFLDFTATPEIINRLVFMDGDIFFSDFEALGCKVKVIIDAIDQLGNRKNLYNFVTETGGLEYGYQTTS